MFLQVLLLLQRPWKASRKAFLLFSARSKTGLRAYRNLSIDDCKDKTGKVTKKHIRRAIEFGDLYNDDLSKAGDNHLAIHNHPSGSIAPSQEDKDVTKRLLSCSELLGVNLKTRLLMII